MNKEDLKKIKVLYYPYKAVKKVITGIVYYIQYIISLLYISKNTKRVKKKIANGEVLNVVFIIQYIPGWNKLEPIYKKMLDDDRFNPIIVCVPLNIQNHILMDDNGNDTYQYFIEHGYKALDALLDDGSWFDLNKLEPDYLFHSRPYNAFMPRIYTSSKIVKYALICNVLYGPNLTENGQNVTLDRDYFKDVFCYFSFEKTDKNFYEKRFALGIKMNIQYCRPYGAIGIEEILISQSDEKNMLFDKTVIWTPRWSTDQYIGGSNFFKYKDDIKKLTEQYPNILFIIRPHPLMFGNFLKTGEMTDDEVQEYKNWCNRANNVFLDEAKEYTKTFWYSNLLITDGSAIVAEYFVTGKPILFCHSTASLKYAKYAQDLISTCYEINDSNGLLTCFADVISGKDAKKELRKRCIDEYFGDAVSNSSKIVEYFAKLN